DVGRDGDEAAGVAADDQHLFAGRVVDDAVGVGVGLDLPEDFVRAGIEDGDVAGLTVGDEAAVQVGDDGDDVVALLAGDVGDGFAVGFAEDHRVRGARDIEEFGLGIDGEVVPPAVAADVEGRGDLVRAGVGGGGVGLG